jgi:hypothetical protein
MFFGTRKTGGSLLGNDRELAVLGPSSGSRPRRPTVLPRATTSFRKRVRTSANAAGAPGVKLLQKAENE